MAKQPIEAQWLKCMDAENLVDLLTGPHPSSKEKEIRKKLRDFSSVCQEVILTPLKRGIHLDDSIKGEYKLAREVIKLTLTAVAQSMRGSHDREIISAITQTKQTQATILKCIFGNPFHPPPAISVEWLTWSEGAVGKVAQVISEEGDFSQLPILGDALEDAGCTSDQLLEHLRSPGPHVRGCWALDLVLGKS